MRSTGTLPDWQLPKMHTTEGAKIRYDLRVLAETLQNGENTTRMRASLSTRLNNDRLLEHKGEPSDVVQALKARYRKLLEYLDGAT